MTGSTAGISFDPWVIAAFLYPVSQLVVFQLVGQLYLTDFLGFALLGFMLRTPDAWHRLAKLRLVFGLLFAWLLSQITTDLVRESPPEDFLRGWAKITFFGVQIAALWLFLPRKRAYIIAFAIGAAISAALGISEVFAGYEWKFGYSRAAALALIAVICLGAPKWPILRSLSPVLLAGLSFFVLFQSARSSFIAMLLAAGVCGLIIAVEKWPALQRTIRPPAFAMALIIGIAGGAFVSAGYSSMVQSGALGAEAQQKHEQQTSGDVPLLIGGRSESLISARAIADSPLLGHGSWAKDRRYVELYRSLRLRLGMTVHDYYFQSRELIPTHSYILGAWVEAGLMGALFWLYVFTLPLVATYALLRRNEPLLPLVAYLAVSLMWAIPFSPFGATERFLVAFQLVVLLWVIHFPDPGRTGHGAARRNR